MKCKKFLLIGLFTLSLAFCSVLSSLPSYAIDDKSITYTANQSVSSNADLFTDCDSMCLSNYSYLIVSPNDGSYNPVQFSGYTYFNILYPRGDGFNELAQPRITTYVYSIFSLPDSITSFKFASSFRFPNSVTFTLTESLPAGDCPVCEECQVCPVIPENPYDPKFDNITMAIYTCGGILLVLYFFYCIYRIIIKNSGVK